MPVFIALVLIWPWLVKIEWLKTGLIISLIGVAIQWWCFACLEKEKVLTIRGPYQLCRNPMYLGRYFLILGFIVAIAQLWVAVIYTIIYWFYMVNRGETGGAGFRKHLRPTLPRLLQRCESFFAWLFAIGQAVLLF